jgi:hypothetical protein
MSFWVGDLCVFRGMLVVDEEVRDEVDTAINIL